VPKGKDYNIEWSYSKKWLMPSMCKIGNYFLANPVLYLNSKIFAKRFV